MARFWACVSQVLTIMVASLALHYFLIHLVNLYIIIYMLDHCIMSCHTSIF